MASTFRASVFTKCFGPQTCWGFLLSPNHAIHSCISRNAIYYSKIGFPIVYTVFLGRNLGLVYMIDRILIVQEVALIKAIKFSSL